MESAKLRITTWNVNGLRAALRKGLAEQIERIKPDVLLLQEVRATPDVLPAEWVEPEGWHVTWHPAEKPGYAGTAVWSRKPHKVMGVGLASGRTKRADDPEGRVLRVRVETQSEPVDVVSVYLPSGSSSEARQASKDAWMESFFPWAAQLQKSRVPTVMGGDFNIAHTEADIWNPKGNAKNSGFLPHEREWFSKLLNTSGARGAKWHDAIRHDAGETQGPYSWWSNRGRARELDRGWRIDYLLLNRPAAKRVLATHTDREAMLACSDHAPVSVDLST
ncbi:MAG: exodeoxyribonuclease III [Planctomycetota bacterium]